MAEALILDSEALNALARPKERGALAMRASAILRIAFDERALVRVPAPVLAETCRGGPREAAIQRLLTDHHFVVVDLTARAAQMAGALLSRAKLDSKHAVDAFVVATALQFDSAVIATGDPRDIGRLSAGHPSVRVFSI
ncbi:MAG: PIN domain-containing protein [Polyangiaceae bacterium]